MPAGVDLAGSAGRNAARQASSCANRIAACNTHNLPLAERRERCQSSGRRGGRYFNRRQRDGRLVPVLAARFTNRLAGDCRRPGRSPGLSGGKHEPGGNWEPSCAMQHTRHAWRHHGDAERKSAGRGVQLDPSRARTRSKVFGSSKRCTRAARGAGSRKSVLTGISITCSRLPRNVPHLPPLSPSQPIAVNSRIPSAKITRHGWRGSQFEM